MAHKWSKGRGGHVAYLPDESMDLLRKLSYEYRVSQWYVIAVALEHYAEELEKGIRTPDDWKKVNGR